MAAPVLQISLDRNPAVYRPGESVAGRATWREAAQAKSIAVRLYWTTSGRVTTDTEVVAESVVENPSDQGETRFSLLLLPAPPSFSGKLITLSWGVELLVEPGEHAAQVEIVVSPTEQEIRLPGLPARPGAKKKWWRPNE
ncbi:MAG: hypothetical protein ACKO2G_10165 [Verrucomicrobiales bacterium]